VNSGEAIYKASIVLLYGAWLFAAMQIMTKEFRPIMLRTIAILGFVISFISLFQFFDIGFTYIPCWGIPAATMTTKNLMSSFLYLTLPATLYVTIIEKKKWSVFGLITLTMSIFVLLIAQTRAVWLATSVAGFVALVLFVLSAQSPMLWKNYKSNIRNSAIAVAACLIAIFVLNVAPRTGPNETSAAEKAGTIANYASDASAEARLNVWDESLEMFKDHPEWQHTVDRDP
jgi:O-antigen ligase